MSQSNTIIFFPFGIAGLFFLATHYTWEVGLEKFIVEISLNLWEILGTTVELEKKLQWEKR